MKRILSIVFLTLAFVPALWAQVQVETKIDSIQMLIGQQVHLRLSVTAGKNLYIAMPRFKPQQMITPGVEVVNDTQADTVDVDNGMHTITRVYTLTSFDEKLYYLPPMTVKVNGKPYTSRSLALKVLTVPVDTLHPDKFYPPKEVQNNPFSWSEWRDVFWMAVLFTLLLAALVYLYTRFRSNKPVIIRVKMVKKVLPHQKAMSNIERIKADKMAGSDNPKEYYTKLTDTIRKYIEERFGFNAMEMTSSEIIDRLKDEQDKEKIDELKQLFETADLVKFAKYSTLINENDMNLVNAVNFINSTKVEEQPTVEKVVPKLSETDKQSMRSRKTLRWIIAGVAVAAVAVLAYIVYAVYNLY